MEILSAGAFINLENQEKIEQLKFTAAELAKAAMETKGFAGDEESSKKLALEFWQGLEYLCRETEKATIKNIFLNHFLDCLRNARPIQTAAIEPPQDLAESITQIDDKIKPEDEFPGVVETTGVELIQTETDETSLQPKDLPKSVNPSAEELEVRTTESNSSESVESQASPAEEKPENLAPEQEKSNEVKPPISNLALPEKEPYQFDKCTVTATIQLLPANDGAASRKAVLSVRTHDFAPQISLVEFSAGNDLTAELAPELEKVLAKYKSELPAKVMDKLKREKTTAKKHAPKTVSEEQTNSPETAKPKQSVQTQTASPKAGQTDAPVIPPPQAGQQGSLFGI